MCAGLANALVFAALGTTPFAPNGVAQATQYPDVPPLLLGAAWYPEQWDEATWEKDLTLMEAGHVHLARIAEFAWSTMEPSEGNFQFEWLDHAIAMAAKHHIVIVLGTPTVS
jgi:beta-galactosidase